MLNLAYEVEQSPDCGKKLKPRGSEILDAIKRRAVTRWGEEKWLLNLVREYVRLEGEDAKPVQRRSQISRIFETGSCTLGTAMILATAVGCKFQLSCTTIELEEF
jgi:hypothetical protein